VLVDFGAAKHATATLLAKTGTGIGKPSYGAPEQMLGKSVFQSDLFGLGVTCLHLLTNVEPFTLYDVLENEYQWRQFLNGKVVSDELGKLLDRMTAYRVKERPNSVTESLQELGFGRETSTSVNTSSGVYSFKAEELQAEHRVSIPSAIPNKQATKSTSSNSPVSNQNVAKSPVELRSAKGINYRELEQLLEQKKWIEADVLTIKLVLEVANRQRNGYLETKDIIKFPSEDLRTIDQLWLYYSNERFGFSIQKDLWLELNNNAPKHNYSTWKEFALQVGWYYTQKGRCKSHTYDEFISNIRNAKNAPLAGLPTLVIGGIFLEWDSAICFLLREDINSLKNKKSAQKFLEEPSSPKQTSTLPKKTKLNTPKSNSHKVASKPVVTQESESITNNKGCMIVILIAFLLMSIATANPFPIVIMILGFYAGQKKKKIDQ
jgi:serine/threonine protein kinase